ncbi:Rho GTPase activation protein [Xylariales sp. AK1849]|nr:Rho GTPase activation protein [Xylariales sp. AK1849]
MMDSFSITTDCIELGNTISRSSFVLNEYVREVREARADLDAVSRELHSLQSVLDLLKDDAGSLPSKLAAETPALLQQCNRVVSELDGTLLALDGSALSRPQKRSQWISMGKQQIAELLPALEAHRIIIGLALDLVGVTDGRGLHDSSEQGFLDTVENEQRQVEVRNEALRIAEEMGRLWERLQRDFDPAGPNSRLSTYFVALRLYANSLVHGKDGEDGAYMGEGPMFGAYVGDTPDSAIEINSESSFRAFDTLPGAESPGLANSRTASQYIQEVNELMDEMIDIPSRAPTPPPKDLKRLRTQRSSVISPFEPPVNNPESLYGVVTEISSQGRKSSSRPPHSRNGRLGRIFGHMRNALSETATNDSASSKSDIRPMTPIIQASLVRRGSRRLSTSIKRLPLWSTELEEPEGPASPGSNTIFGVSLSKSMQAAKSSAKTHHSGSGSSRREFPLCIHKSCSFLQTEGIEAPDVFAEPGDGYRVQKLKDTFSQAPKYGEDINWDNYGVYDAADIILLFLSQLPRPLISESIAKRWISLSRQATLSGSHGTRLDQCIDFWEEALGGLRGPSRSLFKLLLNLWSSIADAAEKNDMTAERLAAVVLKPLMHTSSDKYSTDFMLAVAFLIRRRSEYTMMLNEGRPSRAAW